MKKSVFLIYLVSISMSASAVTYITPENAKPIQEEDINLDAVGLELANIIDKNAKRTCDNDELKLQFEQLHNKNIRYAGYLRDQIALYLESRSIYDSQKRIKNINATALTGSSIAATWAGIVMAIQTTYFIGAGTVAGYSAAVADGSAGMVCMLTFCPVVALPGLALFGKISDQIFIDGVPFNAALGAKEELIISESVERTKAQIQSTYQAEYLDYNSEVNAGEWYDYVRRPFMKGILDFKIVSAIHKKIFSETMVDYMALRQLFELEKFYVRACKESRKSIN